MPVRLSRITFVFVSLSILNPLFAPPAPARSKKRPAPAGGARYAVVADERLSALRDAPGFAGAPMRRLGRGRSVALAGARKTADGASFVQVVVTRRTRGWVQSDGVFAPARAGDDERLLRLVRGSREFDRVERARIFLDTFPRSPHRPAVLLLLAEAAEEAASRLSRDAARRLDAREMEAGGAPTHTYFLNFNGLDRFNRVGVRFVFDRGAKSFRYGGESWREILRRHPNSPEAAAARQRLDSLAAGIGRGAGK